VMRGREVPVEQTHAQRGTKEAVGAMIRKGGSGKGKKGCEGNRGSVRREMWRGYPDDANDVEATTHVEAAPQARTGKSEVLRTAWIIPGVLLR